MKKCIYKITNLVNGKIYIGQTNNYERRQREHQNCAYDTQSKVLYDAIKKYGWENFIMEQIEDYCEDYNEKESFWIKKCNSLTPYGYNVETGICNSSPIVITEDLLQQIYTDLKDDKLSYSDIAIKYNIKTEQTIRDINRGISHRQFDITYPIRKMRNDLAQERAAAVIQDLKHTNLTFKELADLYNCSITCISNINTGIRVHNNNETYPIRPNTRKGQKFSEDVIDQIYEDIISTSLRWTDLAEKYNCNTKVFQHINQGTLHRREGYDYPLRQTKRPVKGAKQAEEIINLLLTTNLTQKEIAQQVGVAPCTVQTINSGKHHRRDNLEYPLRATRFKI